MSSTTGASQAFGAYARYYDLLYRDKDYGAEARYVHQIIRRHSAQPSRMLELGCGTGGHAVHFAQLGYDLHGVDLSPGMLDAARERCRRLDIVQASRLSFELGDARSYRAGKAFDVVVSLFHVMSYQQTNADLAAAFATAAAHLESGGLFVFDFWYGPAVLNDPPAVRVRRLDDDRTRVRRVAEPVLRPNDNVVEVHYEIDVEDVPSGVTERLRELHPMRYLFLSELLMLADAAGFELVDRRAWMSDAEPSLESWNAVVCCRKTPSAPPSPAGDCLRLNRG